MTVQGSDHEITKKEIRGITVRVIISWVAGFASVLIAGAFAYSNIMYTIRDGQKNNQALQIGFDVLRAELKEFEQHQQQDEIRLTIIEEQIKDKIFLTDAPKGSR